MIKMELDAHDLFIAMAIMTRIIRSEYTPIEIWAAVESIIYLYHAHTIICVVCDSCCAYYKETRFVHMMSRSEKACDSVPKFGFF